MTSTMEHEEAQVRQLFERVDAVVEVAHVIEGEHPSEAARLLTVSRNALSHAAPVRVPIAARLLLVSDKTVRSWVSEGLLKPQRPAGACGCGADLARAADLGVAAPISSWRCRC